MALKDVNMIISCGLTLPYKAKVASRKQKASAITTTYKAVRRRHIRLNHALLSLKIQGVTAEKELGQEF